MEKKEKKGGELVKLEPYPRIKTKLTTLSKKYENLVVNEETFEQAKKARLELRENRYEIQNISKNNKSILNDAKKKMESTAEELISIIRPREDEIDGKIKAIEQKREEEREKKRQEEERLKIEKRNEFVSMVDEYSNKLRAASSLEELEAIRSDLFDVIHDDDYWNNLLEIDSFVEMAQMFRGQLESINTSVIKNIEDAKEMVVKTLEQKHNKTMERYRELFPNEPVIDLLNKGVIMRQNVEQFLESINQIETERKAYESSVSMREHEIEREELEKEYVSLFLEMPEDEWNNEVIKKAIDEMKEAALKKFREEKISNARTNELKEHGLYDAIEKKGLLKNIAEYTEKEWNEVVSDTMAELLTESEEEIQAEDPNVDERVEFSSEEELLENSVFEQDRERFEKYLKNFNQAEPPELQTEAFKSLLQEFEESFRAIVNEFTDRVKEFE